MTTILGIDCSTNPRKTGLALADLRDDTVVITQCDLGTPQRSPASIALEWLRVHDEVLIALDAPLGWPKALGTQLAVHHAGEYLEVEANSLFRRVTDTAIKNRLKKQPLDVGANLIARTAVAALQLLEHMRKSSGHPIPLAWSTTETEGWRAIEVYPAATRIGYRASPKGGSLAGLDDVLDCSAMRPALRESADAVDAAVCALAGADFLLDRAVPPTDWETARIEGWIWARQQANL